LYDPAGAVSTHESTYDHSILGAVDTLLTGGDSGQILVCDEDGYPTWTSYIATPDLNPAPGTNWIYGWEYGDGSPEWKQHYPVPATGGSRTYLRVSDLNTQEWVGSGFLSGYTLYCDADGVFTGTSKLTFDGTDFTLAAGSQLVGTDFTASRMVITDSAKGLATTNYCSIDGDGLSIGGNTRVDKLNVDTDTLVVNRAGFEGKVGVGTHDPSYKLSIESTNVRTLNSKGTFTAGDNFAGNQYETHYNNLTSTLALYTSSYIAYLNGTTSAALCYAAYYRPYMMSSGNVTNLIGLAVEPYFWTGASGPVSGYVGIQTRGGAYGSGASSEISSWTQIQIINPIAAATVGTKYGLHIDTISGGSVANWGIYSVGGNSYFGGSIYFGQTDGAERIASDADGYLDIYAGTAIRSHGSLFPSADNTYYLGKNDDDSPLAWKGLILKDTTNGRYYRIEVVNGVVTATDLTD
jgi:hypothetical protein